MKLRHVIAATGLTLGACASPDQDVTPPTSEVTVHSSYTAEQATLFVEGYQGQLNKQLAHSKRLELGVALGWCTTWDLDGQKIATYNPVLGMPIVDSGMQIDFAHIPLTISPGQSSEAGHTLLVPGPHVVEGSYYDPDVSPGMSLKWYPNMRGSESTEQGPNGLVPPVELEVEQVFVGSTWLLRTLTGEPVGYTYTPNSSEIGMSNLELCILAEQQAYTILSTP